MVRQGEDSPESPVSIPVTEGLNGFLGQFTTPDFRAFLIPLYTQLVLPWQWSPH